MLEHHLPRAAPATYTLSHPKHSGAGSDRKTTSAASATRTTASTSSTATARSTCRAGRHPVLEQSRDGRGFLRCARRREWVLRQGRLERRLRRRHGVRLQQRRPRHYASLQQDLLPRRRQRRGQLPVADRGTDSTPALGPASTAACGTCHRSFDREPPRDPSHPKHAGTAAGQYAIGCQACHYGTTTDGTTFASPTLHVNTIGRGLLQPGRRRSRGSLPPARTAATPRSGSGYGTCAFTYCHSRGNDTDPTAGYPNDPLATPATRLGPDTAPAGAVTATRGGIAGVDHEHARLHRPRAEGEQARHPQQRSTNSPARSATTRRRRTGRASPTPPAREPDVRRRPECLRRCALPVHLGGPELQCRRLPRRQRDDHLGDTAPTPPYACNVCHGMAGGAVTNADVDDFSGWAADADDVEDQQFGVHWRTAAATATTPARTGRTGLRRLPRQHRAARHHGHPLRGRTPSGSWTRHRVGRRAVQLLRHLVTPCHAVRDHRAADGPGHLDVDDAHLRRDGRPRDTRRNAPGRPGPCRAPARVWIARTATTRTATATSRWSTAGVRQGAVPAAGASAGAADRTARLSFTERHDRHRRGARTPTPPRDLQRHLPGVPRGRECRLLPTTARLRRHGCRGESPSANPGDCSVCHLHDKGFAPMACDGATALPLRRGQHGAGDDAPVVMTWYNVNGHGSKTFDPDGAGPAGHACGGLCGLPRYRQPGARATHLTGTI